MERFNIDYDKESDDLFLYAKEKSKGSIEIGDLVFDFDRSGKLVGIEVLNASAFLNDCVANGGRISKEFLSELVKCEIEVKQRNNFLFIKMFLIGKKVTIPCQISAPAITETSPALAYA